QPDIRPGKPDVQRSAFRLPRPLTEFVGREQDLGRVALLVPKSRLVTLTGPGGIGKTRLAIEVAQLLKEEFPDGVCFTDLSAVADENLVESVIANAVGAGFNKRIEIDGDLIELLADRKLLVVLDSCEHVIGACAETVEAMLEAAPNLHVLATSRQALGI